MQVRQEWHNIIMNEALAKSKVAYYTTGQAAKICGVNFRTVIRWIERGLLRAHTLPGRGDRRIERQELLRFLDQEKIRLPKELKGIPQRVLIVDDDVHVARAFQRVLRKEGIESTLAHDGFEAGFTISSTQPQVVVLDLNMPQIDGLSVLKTIRSNPNLTHTKVFIVSGTDTKKMSMAMELGADDFAAKPVKTSVFIKKILRLMEE